MVATEAIVELRTEITARGGRGAQPRQRALEQLLERLPDVDLAATAVTQKPRPAWVHDLMGHDGLRSAGSAVAPHSSNTSRA